MFRGLTATCLDMEVMSRCPYLNSVKKGEAELPIAQLRREPEGKRAVSKAPNPTYRDGRGKVQVNECMKVFENLDEFEFTGLDPVKPRRRVPSTDVGPKNRELCDVSLCRGCSFNCITCGGSTYSYQKLMRELALRSPEKFLKEQNSFLGHWMTSLKRLAISNPDLVLVFPLEC